MYFGLSVVNKNQFCTFEVQSFVLENISPGLHLSEWLKSLLGKPICLFSIG